MVVFTGKMNRTNKLKEKKMEKERLNEYNGWENYETWCVKSWLDNDEFSQNLVLTMAEDAIERAKGDDAFSAKHLLAIALQDEVNEWLYHYQDNTELPGMFNDLLSSSVGRVNYSEIAENVLEDME